MMRHFWFRNVARPIANPHPARIITFCVVSTESSGMNGPEDKGYSHAEITKVGVVKVRQDRRPPQGPLGRRGHPYSTGHKGPATRTSKPRRESIWGNYRLVLPDEHPTESGARENSHHIHPNTFWIFERVEVTASGKFGERRIRSCGKSNPKMIATDLNIRRSGGLNSEGVSHTHHDHLQVFKVHIR